MRSQLDKLIVIYGMIMQRSAREDERQKVAAKIAAMKTLDCTLPSAKPPRVRLNMSPKWVLKKGIRRENLDPRQAITFVLQALGMH